MRIVEDSVANPPSEREMLIIELPPGVGKSLSGVHAAVKQAAKRNVVVYALPNHNSMIKALEYALETVIEMARAGRKPPYIIYYAGVERFCPLRDDNVFKRIIEEAYNNGEITSEVYKVGMRDGYRGIAVLKGQKWICRNLCPIYKAKYKEGRARIYIPRFVYESIRRTGGRIASLIVEARKRGLVYVYDPRLKGTAPERDSFCVRVLFMKPFAGKRLPPVWDGSLIITPLHSLEFIASVLLNFRRMLEDRGFELPRPIFIIDEYDSLFYKYTQLPLVSVSSVEREVGLAWEIIMEEREKRRRRDPDHSPDRLAAAIYAYVAGSKLVEYYKSVVSGRRKPSKNSILDAVLVETASMPINTDKGVMPPFAPRYVSPGELFEMMSKAYEDAIDFAIRIDADDEVHTPIDAFTISELAARWSEIVSEKFKTTCRGGLLHAYGKLFRPACVYDGFKGSAISYLATLPLRVPEEVYLHYRITHAGKIVYARGATKRTGWGMIIDAATYDLFIPRLAEEARVIMLSATGLPWGAEFFMTRSRGAGKYGKTVFAGSTILSKFTGVKFIERKSYADREEEVYVVEGLEGVKIRRITLNKVALYEYASSGVYFELPVSGFLPPKNSSHHALMESLRPYVEFTLNLFRQISKKRSKYEEKPVVLVFTQRKDVSMLFADVFRRITRGVLEYCGVSGCYPEPPRDIAYIRVDLGFSELLVSWFRSRFTRGIDIPKGLVPVAVLVIGTPYKPPTAFDLYVPPGSTEAASYASMLAIDMYVGSIHPHKILMQCHMPIDIIEAIGELTQAIGRALRAAWRYRIEHGKRVKVVVILPRLIRTKILKYAPDYMLLMQVLN